MSSLIERLGGASQVAKELGLKPNVVGNWAERGVAWKWRPALAALANQRGIPVPDDFLMPHKSETNGGARQPEPSSTELQEAS